MDTSAVGFEEPGEKFLSVVPDDPPRAYQANHQVGQPAHWRGRLRDVPVFVKSEFRPYAKSMLRIESVRQACQFGDAGIRKFIQKFVCHLDEPQCYTPVFVLLLSLARASTMA